MRSPMSMNPPAMRTCRTVLVCCALALMAAVPMEALASPQQAEAPGQDLFLMATTRTATMSSELEDAAKRNYRVLSAAGGVGSNEVIVVLQPSPGGYQYRLVATMRTSTLQNELNAAAKDGFRIIPRAVTIKRNASMFSNDDYELLVILEKSPDAAPPVEYRVLATSRTGTLQEELRQSAVDGWRLVTLVVRSEVLALLEREAQ